MTVAATMPRARWGVILALSAIWSGLTITEQISNQVLPLTLRRFTSDASIIGYVLAVNPLFGFIAQPLVGILSDRIWTPIGRRAFFLVTGAPVVALCLLGVPEAQLLSHLIALVVVYQFFQDVLWGSDHPLLADLVPPAQRTLVTGLMMASSQAIGFLFNRYGVGFCLAEYGEAFLYRLGGIAQIALVSFSALFLHERRTTQTTRPRLTIRRYAADFLGHPTLRKFAVLGFVQFLFQHVVLGFVVLFGIESMRLSSTEFGRAYSWMPVTCGLLAIPYGVAAERWLGKRTALIVAYGLAVAGCFVGWRATAAWELAVALVLFSFCVLGGQVAQKAYFTEYIPRDIIGQLSGAYNICVALGRTLALAGGGWIIHRLGDDYRSVWPIGIVLGAVTLLAAVALPRSNAQRV